MSDNVSLLSLEAEAVLLHDSLLVVRQALDKWGHDKPFLGSTPVTCQHEQVGHLLRYRDSDKHKPMQIYVCINCI